MKKISRVLNRALLATMVFAFFIGEVDAARISILPPPGANLSKKQQAGWQACVDWCNAHNKTIDSRDRCITDCDRYWTTHQG